ncbi:citrate synthase [Flindersiella endophytica]
MTTDTPRWLSTQQTADLLGVKPETVYAYVSRGVLQRHQGPDRRSSRFARAEVERLAARQRRGGRAGALEVVIDTELTLLDPAGGLYYRGEDATRLALTWSFEQVAELLWGTSDNPGSSEGPDGPRGLDALGNLSSSDDSGRAEATGGLAGASGSAAAGEPEGTGSPSGAGGAGSSAGGAVGPEPWRAPDAMVRVGRGVAAALPDSARAVDRMRVVVAAIPAVDPHRDDRRAASVARAGRHAVAAVVDCLPERSPSAGTSIAHRLWSRLSPAAPTVPQLDALNAALALLADHELAASTLAARVAASAWADPYLVLSTGLAAGGGALHAAVSTAVETMLRSAADGHDVVGERLRAGERVPGFGHKVYEYRDPRADLLLDLVRQAGPSPLDAVIEHVLQQMEQRGMPAPNVDLALGALVVKFGLTPGSGEVVFLLARMAGLIAHATEEYPHRLRFRPRALYTGASPAKDS